MKEACLRLPDGRQLAWYEVGRGRPLVLLHGWAMSAGVFSEIASLLSEDFRLLIPDLPGHGRSTPAALNDLSGISEDLHRWIESVVSTPVILCGWSLGGMLAMDLARQHPSSFDRLLLVGTTPRFTVGENWDSGLPLVQVRALERNLGRQFETTLAGFFAKAFAGEEISSARLRTIRGFAVKQSALPNRDAALSLLGFLAVQDQREIVGQLHLPTSVIHGELDQITPVIAGRRLVEMLPNAQFHEFSGVGHGPFLSRPREFVAKVREFADGAG